MTGQRRERERMEDRPHDWDEAGRGVERGRRAVGSAPMTPKEFHDHERVILRGPGLTPQDGARGERPRAVHVRQPGPDGAPKPEYTGPRDTEGWLVKEWQTAYERACCEVRVEILKERIRKSWGKSIAKVAEELDKMMLQDWKLCQQKGDHSAQREKLLKAFAKVVLDSYNSGPKLAGRSHRPAQTFIRVKKS